MPFDSIHTLMFLGIVALLLLLEALPGTRRELSRPHNRWTTNLSLLLVSSLAISLFFPVGLYSVALAQDASLVLEPSLPQSAEIVLVVLLLDFWRYWEHRVFHEVPLFWRIHLVHHSDTFIDVTTAERHHPLEGLITLPLALMLVLALGLSATALAVYLLVGMASSLLVHSNVRLPHSIDDWLRGVLVTPSVHAIHHASEPELADTNYGAVLSIWDRMFGTYSNPAEIQVKHFGLEYFHKRGENTFLQVLLQPLKYRPGMFDPEREPDEVIHTTNALRLNVAWRRALLQIGLGLALAALAMWLTVENLMSIWSSTEAYQYAWLVVPFFVYAMGWHFRTELLSLSPRPDFTGVAVIIFALALSALALVVQIGLGQHIGFVLMLQGLFIAILGRHLWWRFLPVFGTLFFLIPSGDLLQPLLRSTTVEMIAWFSEVMEIPYTVDGFVIFVADHRYVVLDACSGLSFVTLATFLSYSLGTLLYRSLPKVLGMTVFGGVLGVCANGLRVNSIVWLDWINGTQMDLSAHKDMQLLALIVLLGVMFLGLSWLRPDSSTPAKSEASNGGNHGYGLRGYAPAALAFLMVATVGVSRTLSSGDNDTASGPQHSTDMSMEGLLPIDAGWTLDEVSKTATLRLAPQGPLQATVVQALPGNRKLAVPRPPHGGWREAKIENQKVCQQAQCFSFVHTQWNRPNSDAEKHIFYTYHIGDLVTDSKLTYPLATGWNRVRGHEEARGIISFVVDGKPPSPSQLAEFYTQIKRQI